MTRSERHIVAVFLDRDGVINRKPAEGDYVRDWAGFEFLPGVPEALAGLHAAGAALIVVTNQRGIARGLVTSANLDDVHQRMTDRLAEAGAPLAGIYVCPHERDSCDCRKPSVGLFVRAQGEMPWIELGRAHVIGDSLSDMTAGWQLGMDLWLVGDNPRRATVAQEATQRGMRIRGEADSIAELVSIGEITTALQIASVTA